MHAGPPPSQNPAKFSGHKSCEGGDIKFGGNRYCEGEDIKFGGNRYCDSGDIMVLVCRVISHNHMIKESCDFMGRSPSRWDIIVCLPRDLARPRYQSVT